jgi:type IV fimbrial biogenesis protein FimT
MSRSRSRRPSGFTLVELVLVMAILAIVAGIAAPRYATATARFRVDAAARRIGADLGLARARAQTTSAPVTVRFDVGGNSYEMLSTASPLAGAANYVTVMSEEPYQAKLVSATFGGSSDMTFDGYGRPASSGTVVVKVGSVSKTITVDAGTGRAAVQ